MNLIFRTILPLSVTFLTLMAASARELKIGVVDMQRVFAESPKTMRMQKDLDERKMWIKKENDKMAVEYKDLLETYQSLQREVQDETLSPELRQQKRDEGEEIRRRLVEMERNRRENDVRFERQIRERTREMRQGVLADILAVLDELAKTRNYDIIIDKSGASRNGLPLLLYSRDRYDFTDEIIDHLNAVEDEKN